MEEEHIPYISLQKEMVSHVHESDSVRNELADNRSIYGENVGDSIIDFLVERRNDEPFEWAHERMGFEGGEQDFDYL